MSKIDWVLIIFLVVVIMGGTIIASVAETTRRERTRAADVGNGYWCPKHEQTNIYHYTKKECKHEHNN